MLELFTRSRRTEPWVGVDLDGTLAYGVEGAEVNTIGEPVQPMLRRVKKAMASGRKIKIFTARAVDRRQVPLIQAWCVKHGLGRLEVTCIKDPDCEEIWDDRARHVVVNTGAVQ
jgi:hypothetical protein